MECVNPDKSVSSSKRHFVALGRKKILYFALLLGSLSLLLCGLYLYRHRDERQIKKNLKVMGRLLSREPKESGLALAVKATKFAAYFTPDCTVIYGSPVPELSGREKIRWAVMTAHKAFPQLKVKGLNVKVTLFGDHKSASTSLTVEILATQGGGEELYDAREVILLWQKRNRHWEIKEVRAVGPAGFEPATNGL